MWSRHCTGSGMSTTPGSDPLVVRLARGHGRHISPLTHPHTQQQTIPWNGEWVGIMGNDQILHTDCGWKQSLLQVADSLRIVDTVRVMQIRRGTGLRSPCKKKVP